MSRLIRLWRKNPKSMPGNKFIHQVIFSLNKEVPSQTFPKVKKMLSSCNELKAQTGILAGKKIHYKMHLLEARTVKKLNHIIVELLSVSGLGIDRANS